MTDERGHSERVPSVRFERRMPAPVERVWEHLTNPARLPGWFGADSRIEPRVGGGVWIMGGHVRGVVTRWRPLEQLSYTWNVFAAGDPHDAASAYPESLLTITLAPDGEDVRLSLLHLPVLAAFEARNAMGWHSFLDMLGAALRGEPAADRMAVMKRNAVRYGVDPDTLGG